MGAAPPVDVLVIGSGPAGAVVTHTLATRGFDVLCLEQGDWVNADDFPANRPEWELLCHQQWHHDPNLRANRADYPVETSDSELSPVMFNGVGGSSIMYGGQWLRLLPSDFRVRSLDDIADDWPLAYEELKPYHDEVDRFLGVAGVEGDPAYPDGLTYPMPPHPLGKVGRRAAEGMNRLGWHWWPGANAIVGYKHQTLEPCARWGTCEFGCPAGAKASFDLIYLPQALKAGARLQTGARVRKITTDAEGLATGATWIDTDGRQHHQPARTVVVCANGVGTPRLLQLSASARHPDGLANSSGLVGRNLMLHPNATVVGYYEDELDSWMGPAGELIHSMEFYETRPEHPFVGGAKWNAMPMPGPFNALEAQQELPFDDRWGAGFHEATRNHARGVLWAANASDLPEAQNRVTLDPALTDGDGVPAPKVEYRLGDNTRAILAHAVARMTEAHEAMGATRTVPVELWTDQPGHLLGTARMGDDPARSVVDAFGRAHDVPNLFVADGSVFVTSGGVNPTSTITALALRIAMGIADGAAGQVVSKELAHAR